MQATPSTTTLQRSHESLEHCPNQPKVHPFQGFEEDVSDSLQAERHSRRLCEWASTFWCTLESNYPRVTRRMRQFLLYMKGPRPVIDLLEPSPWIAALTIRGRTYGLPLEHRLVHLTRPLHERPWVLLFLAIIYITGLSFFVRAQSFLTPAGSWVGCTSAYWGANDGCGLDGAACEPFTDSSFDFRCPAQCSSVKLQNPRAIGDGQVDFVPLIVGGGDANFTYRGDSFLCAAAIQAGLVSNLRGGCATANLIGNFTDFLPRSAHGLMSIGFPSVFPLSFRLSATSPFSHCTDLRSEALVLNVLVTVALFMIIRPRPILTFWCMVCIGFWHITLFSQPRTQPPDIADGFGTFLPALFVCYAFWRLAIRFVLPTFSKMPIEATILYLGPFWVTVLANLTTERIPIDRLTAKDITEQRGGLLSLIVIVLVLLVIIINQIRVIRKTGWLPYYLGCYTLGGLVTLVFALLPTLNLRLHHYIVAMVLMPGTAFPTRLSAIYQGFLLGLFLNGTAAFGFAPMFQTTAQLQRDGTLGTDLPSFVTNSTNYNSSVPFLNQTIFWSPLPKGGDWDGFALLVDDVERYVGTALNYSLTALQSGLPHFFRIAFTSAGVAGDFTKAATLWANGTWVDPSGPS
ncbi:hypothetical protein BJV78DRAFT_1116451 [Lactifluus subvellereus]|nr:hypothetical protein BJV78DRAFT_1116451 [Lactifluus subvellereus]